jgi:beta-galactosidase
VWIAGLILFCYNDYRTHVGDKGSGVMKERIHGVVDLYGAHKPSFQVLRFESSPIESVSVSGQPPAMDVTVRARPTVPSYRMHAYKLLAMAYGPGDIPLERLEAALPTMNPGQSATVSVVFRESSPIKVTFDVMRPTYGPPALDPLCRLSPA